MMLRSVSAQTIFALIITTLSRVDGHLYVGHLTTGDDNIPTDSIANCISGFLLCTDSKSDGRLLDISNNCYEEFQTCSGSKIEISEIPEVSDDKPFNCGSAKQIYYPAPVDCHSYYHCVDQNKPPVKLYCDSGLQFNPITQKCGRPENVANVRPECDYKSESLLKEVNNFHFKLPSAKQPKVLVVDGSRVGIQNARNGRNIADKINEKDLTVQTVFEKVFSTSKDIKSEVILGALRNILLVCEICKVPPLKPVKTTERPGRNLCIITDWAVSGTCSAACGNGTQRYTRDVKDCNKNITENTAVEEFRDCKIKECPVPCEWNEWSESSPCTATCGDAFRTLTRDIKTEAKDGGAECTGESTKLEKCNLPCCPLACGWGSWETNGTCSESCGDGVQRFTRLKNVVEKCGGSCDNVDTKEEKCKLKECSEDCVWDLWSDWSICSVDLNACGPTGFKTRTRSILKNAAHGGKPCEGKSMEKEDCGGKPMEECEANCTLSAWMEVGRCSAACGSGTQKYKRFVISEAKNGGTPCTSFSLEETRQCLEKDCVPENCTLAGWTVAGPCSATCGDGTQKYTRAIISHSKHGGIDCTDFALSETRPCNIKECARDCEWSKWSAESVCSATCGKGTKTLSRTIIREAEHGGKMCVGEHTKSVECNLVQCPEIPCKWGNWSESACSTTCGNGTKTLSREIVQHPQHGGKECVVGEHTKTEECNLRPCEVPCKWSEWKMTASGRTCGPNVTTKFTRYVVQKAKYGGADCEGVPIKIEKKNLSPCEVDCKLGDWSEPQCPSCQPRDQPEIFTTITRQVERPAAHGGRNNCTDVQKVVKCDGLPPCKEHCRWGEWTFSECSATCGTSFRTKSRVVVALAQHGGEQCRDIKNIPISPLAEIGSQEFVKELCALNSCPTDCAWSNWTFSLCSATCGPTAFRTKSRMIIASALNGGEKCRDSANKEIDQFGYREIVNEKCPGNRGCPKINCRWSKWEISENCNGTCLKTDVYRRYTRTIIQQADNGGKECVGGTFKYEKCRDLPRCPKCLDPQIDGSCERHECFAPCNCNEYEPAFAIPGPPITKAKSIEVEGSETAQILANISELNKNLFNISAPISSNTDIAAQFNEDGSRCYCHSKCCNESSVTSPPDTPPAKLTMIDRLCLMLWKCLTDFIRTESERETTITQEPRMLSAANCCPTLRLSTTNEDTNTYWGPKLGVYQYQSLDKNGSAVYKHTSEKGTYLYRSPLGNWLGGSVVGENKGWIQQTTCDNIKCPEECTAGWQYSDGETWKLDESLKPACGCTPGTRVPSASDTCNTCICNEDGTIGDCTKRLCPEDNSLENLIEENIANFLEGTVRSGRNLKDSDAEYSYNINDVYTNLLLTPQQQLNARVSVVGSKNPYDSENNLGAGKSLVHHAPRPSDNDI